MYAANDADETLRAHRGWPDLVSIRPLACSAECHPAGDVARPSRTSHRQTPVADCIARIHIILVYAPVWLVHPHHSWTPASASYSLLAFVRGITWRNDNVQLRSQSQARPSTHGRSRSSVPSSSLPETGRIVKYRQKRPSFFLSLSSTHH